MAFVVGDVVKKVGGSQKYKIVEVKENSKYDCNLEPKINPVILTFKEADLELA